MHKSICRDPSSEQSHREGSDEGSQHMVSMRNKKNYLSIIIKYSVLSRALGYFDISVFNIIRVNCTIIMYYPCQVYDNFFFCLIIIIKIKWLRKALWLSC